MGDGQAKLPIKTWLTLASMDCQTCTAYGLAVQKLQNYAHCVEDLGRNRYFEQISVHNETWKVDRMLILQIIIVPVFALTLLGAVFMIGVGSTISTRQDGPEDQAIGQEGTSYPSDPSSFISL